MNKIINNKEKIVADASIEIAKKEFEIIKDFIIKNIDDNYVEEFEEAVNSENSYELMRDFLRVKNYNIKSDYDEDENIVEYYFIEKDEVVDKLIIDFNIKFEGDNYE